MNFKEFLETDITIRYAGTEATVKGKDFRGEMKWSTKIYVNGGLEYVAELTADQISELIEKANSIERNTAYDPVEEETK